MKTRDRIIHAALALFNDRGEPNVTTNHIAADLAISPGNLYYHFRNKEQIIHSIFDLYATDLQVSFQPRSEAETTESLLSYLDAVFLLMWRYRFFYANLPELQLKYLEAQAKLRSNIAILMQSLKDGGLVDIDDEDLKTLAETLLMVASSWISYQTTQVAGAKITPTIIYKGVIQILNIVRPLATPLGCERVEALKQYYEQQEQQAKR